MKKFSKTGFAAIALIAMVSASSCTVEYRTRHPRPVRHKRVIVVGMAEPATPVDASTVAKIAQQNPIQGEPGADVNKTK